MEVVSPLTFDRANPGGKRRFGSPLRGDSEMTASATAAAEDFDMDDCPVFGYPAAKRRKRFPNGGEGEFDLFSSQSKENWSISSFVQAPSRSIHQAAGKISHLILVRQSDR